MAPPPRLERAACRGAPLDTFFPKRGESAEEARRICATCVELERCRRYALEEPRLVGIWGGLSGHERLLLARGGSVVTDLAEVEEPSVEDLEAVVAEEAELAEEALEGCSVCGAPRTGQRSTCSRAACVAEHRRRRKRASQYARRTASNGNGNGARAANPGKAETLPVGGNGAPDLEHFLAVLVGAVTSYPDARVTVEVAGVAIKVRRTNHADHRDP
jgi:WhiB family redox-sensing transcriptional regulator